MIRRAALLLRRAVMAAATGGKRHLCRRCFVPETPAVLLRRVALQPIVPAVCIAFAMIAPAASSPADAHARRCPGNDWEIIGADEQEHALICAGVAGAAAFLSSCGVASTAATRVRVVDTLPVSCGFKAWGHFDATSDEILLGRPAACIAYAPEGSFFARLPVQDAYMSIAAHEATHALLYAQGLGTDRRLEHEYIATVVQMQVLPEALREAVLAPLGIADTVEIWELNLLLLGLNPLLFAGRSWRHFENETDNCALIRALATGALRLPDYAAF